MNRPTSTSSKTPDALWPVRRTTPEIDVRVLRDVVIAAQMADVATGRRACSSGTGRPSRRGTPAPSLRERSTGSESAARRRSLRRRSPLHRPTRLLVTSGRSVHGSTWLCSVLTLPNAARILPTCTSRPPGMAGNVTKPSSSSTPSSPNEMKEVRARVGIDDGLKRRLGLVHRERGRRVHRCCVRRHQGSRR